MIDIEFTIIKICELIFVFIMMIFLFVYFILSFLQYLLFYSYEKLCLVLFINVEKQNENP